MRIIQFPQLIKGPKGGWLERLVWTCSYLLGLVWTLSHTCGAIDEGTATTEVVAFKVLPLLASVVLDGFSLLSRSRSGGGLKLESSLPA